MKKSWSWIKRIFGVLVLAAFVVSGFAAGEKGEGIAAFSTLESITSKVLGGVTTLEFTAKTTNMAGGVITGTFPSGWGTPTTITAYNKVGSYVYMSATSDNISGDIVVFTHGGGYYWKVTIAVLNIDQKAYVYFNNMTTTATAGNQTFTFKQAADSTVTSTADALAANPYIYVWSSNNPIQLMTVEPTPQILSTDKNNGRIQFKFTVSASGGQVIVAAPVATPGAVTTPNPVTFMAAADNAIGSIHIVSTPGVFGSPTINATQVVFPVITAGAGCVAEILHGDPTGTPTVHPFGTNYAKNLRYNMKANAIFPAATVTPITTCPQFTVLVPTATIVCTVVNDDGEVKVQYNAFASYNLFGKSNKFEVSYGALTKTVVPFTTGMKQENLGDLQWGYYNIFVLGTYNDNLNDGALRTVTSTAVALYRLPNEDFNYTQLQSEGRLKTYSWINQSVTVANFISNTRNANATLLLDWSMFGDTKSQAVLMRNYVTQTAGSAAADEYFSQVFPIPVTPGVSVSTLLEDGADGVKNIFINYIELPTR